MQPSKSTGVYRADDGRWCGYPERSSAQGLIIHSVFTCVSCDQKNKLRLTTRNTMDFEVRNVPGNLTRARIDENHSALPVGELPKLLSDLTRNYTFTFVVTCPCSSQHRICIRPNSRTTFGLYQILEARDGGWPFTPMGSTQLWTLPCEIQWILACARDEAESFSFSLREGTEISPMIKQSRVVPWQHTAFLWADTRFEYQELIYGRERTRDWLVWVQKLCAIVRAKRSIGAVIGVPFLDVNTVPEVTQDEAVASDEEEL